MIRGLRLCAVLGVLAVVSLDAQEPSVDAQLAQAKAALARYQDPIAAVHDGYLSTIACVDFPKGGGEGAMAYKPGAMGVHLLNTSLIGPTLDPTKPQVLIYEPNGDKLVLVAAEWFLPVMPNITEPPKVFGKSLEGPMEGHAPFMPEGLHHWDLHVWLWRDNPSGMFSPTNPNVKCPKAAYSFAGDAPKMVPMH
ncbi:MAG TPA: hypothetical protein VLV16_05270 [Gemmatimonadales bacterium]|nr:hypothetical protein [Gemmatimonadales bacterium]